MLITALDKYMSFDTTTRTIFVRNENSFIIEISGLFVLPEGKREESELVCAASSDKTNKPNIITYPT